MEATEPSGRSDEEPDVELQDPAFIRLMGLVCSRAQQSKAAKDESLGEWSAEESDEDILADIGLDMDALRQDP